MSRLIMAGYLSLKTTGFLQDFFVKVKVVFNFSHTI